LQQTAEGLGADREVHLELMAPLLDDAPRLVEDLLAPPGAQRHPVALARFGQHAIRSATGFAASHFHGDAARALFAGNAAHSFLPLDAPLTAGFALFLMLLGHAYGWPIAAGGAGNLGNALVSILESLSGKLVLDHPVRGLSDVSTATHMLFDTDPGQMARIAGSALPDRFRARLMRHRYGPGAFKLDYALACPVPWTAPACHQSGTVHLGGTLEEIAQAEAEVNKGRHPERPFVLVSQPSLFDPARAPAGKHTLWAYCHMPPDSPVDMTEPIERQLERFAPGFRDLVLARHAMGPRELQAVNANLIGGAVNGGLQDLRAYLTWALARPSPYATPNPALFLCSAATPPGGGVHGMAGYHAAEYALRRRIWWRPRRPENFASV
jgi:phytoene dehydrogenase-like protein